MRFEFATSARVVFGEGTLAEAAPAAAALGRRPLVVTGRSTARAERLIHTLGGDCRTFSVAGEPTVALARAGAAEARETGRDVVIAIGGGSVLDAAKAIAALAANAGDVLDYLEVVGRGQPLENASLPVIAIPTTAGTGSEVTRNAVLASTEHRVKASLRSASMLPRVAIVDPELTYDLPPALTAATGLDALTQLIEPYVSSRANPVTDAFALEGIGRARRALERAVENGHDAEARRDMALASLLGGMCLANAGLGVVHGFAAPVGGMFEAPHGAVCAAVLPYGMRANIQAAGEGETRRRYQQVATLLTGEAGATPEDGAEWVAALCRRIGIPGLSAYGVRPEHVADLVEKASAASSMKANPVKLLQEALRQVLEASL